MPSAIGSATQTRTAASAITVIANGLCEALDGDAGPGVDPSCPRSEGLLATLASGVQYNSVDTANEWQLQETVAPMVDTVGAGCNFSNLTTGASINTTDDGFGVLGATAEGLGRGD